MEREWLAAELQAGRSIESIAREAARSPSTVAYWLSRHGLKANGGDRHSPKGGVPRERLQAMVEHRIVTGYYPRLTLAENQHFASKGGYLVRFADGAGRKLVADREWLTP